MADPMGEVPAEFVDEVAVAFEVNRVRWVDGVDRHWVYLSQDVRERIRSKAAWWS